jgi:hypothetical protein
MFSLVSSSSTLNLELSPASFYSLTRDTWVKLFVWLLEHRVRPILRCGFSSMS